ncbi:MAG: MATE family efflux transporter [Lachnospiraceae bacterium]|nr:MATE family efflux transporter [Lachnospiraceae bacterium]
MNSNKDFSQGSVWKNILQLAIPMTLAQLINVLYNIIDRIYIGHIDGASSEALTGVGLTLPIITIITAFTNLFGTGGAPLFSMARGAGDEKRAEKIMGNSFLLLMICGAVLAISCLLLKRPLLYLFGASDVSYPYANAYLSVYLLGTIPVMISVGMNSYINAQGFGITGMLTVSIGAVLNLILDPIFIFGLQMGVTGAALATVISQTVSAIWVLVFLFSKKTPIPLRRHMLHPEAGLIKEISTLGFAGFIMQFTNGAVQIACNAMLQNYGGDLYVSIMTVLSSVREIVNLPVNGLSNAAQPVISFNYGAKHYGRVKSAIRFMSVVGIVFMLLIWLCLTLFPGFFIHLFSSDADLLEKGVSSMHLYFFGIFMMALQFSGQSTFTALGKSKQAIFFSIFRKIVIVVPLTLLLPGVFGLGTAGVFIAEPISNFVGGSACFITMILTVWRKLPADNQKKSYCKQ